MANRSARKQLRALALLAAVGAGCSESGALRVESHAASERSAHVNAHLVLGARDAILVDTAMTLPDARSLARAIEGSGRNLRAIFVTNSQPDKHLGLEVMAARFPNARILATPEVVADIEERGPGYLERLRARYGDDIASRLVVPEPFPGDRLQLEGREIRVHRFRGGECPNAAALYVPHLRALFPGAIVFEGSHLFLRERDIPGWREHLAWIRAHGGIDVIYPGHGEAGGLELIDAMERYLDAFEAAVAGGDADAAYAALTQRYPDYRLERLLREYSLPAYLGVR